MLLVGRREERKQVVLAGFLKLGTDALDFLRVLLGRVGLIQDVVLLVLQKHAPETVLDVFTEGAEFRVTAERTMEAEVACMTIRAMDALIRPFTLETVR